MGKEQPANYYNAIYKKSDSYKLHWSKSRYVKLWEAVLAHLDLKKSILDIGCGPGQFANMCLEKGVKHYDGIDFSQTAIDKAKETNKVFKNATFFCRDLFKTTLEVSDNCQIVICETLEHIENDIQLLASIKELNPGTPFVFTVPTFNDPGHVRFYKTPEEWKKRFEKVVTIEGAEVVGPWIIIFGKF